MRLKTRVSNERGAVLLTVALVMTVLMLLVAGGISTFTLFGAQRELQKAADQAALAGAAALPLAYTGAILGNLENLPLPDGVPPITDPNFNIFDAAGLDIPRLSQLAPDPRAVACSYGHESLENNSASLINSFGTAPSNPPSTVCSDSRVAPTMQSTTLLNCVNSIVGSVTSQVTSAVGSNPLLSGLLNPILTAILGDPDDPAPGTVRALVNDLNMALPAVLSPRMRVEVRSGFEPPLLSVITGDDGLQMRATAVAQRRLKNAVVVPLVPGGEIQPTFNLNQVIGGRTRNELLATLGTVNTQLNSLTSRLPNCNNLLTDLQTDVSDIYNPPLGPAPSMIDVARAAAEAAQSASGRTGVAVNDLGEAFLGVAVGNQPVNVSTLLAPLGGLVVSLLSPALGSLQIPALDVTPVVFRELGNGDVGGVVIAISNAQGLFRATLVN
jgi:hypothetical protein